LSSERTEDLRFHRCSRNDKKNWIGYFRNATRSPRRKKHPICRAHIGQHVLLILLATFSIGADLHANPYLSKPGEPLTPAASVRVRSPAAFIHFYSALFKRLFDKYGIKIEHVTLRGGIVSLAALSADEIQFIYCSADPMIPRMAAGADAKLIGSPIVACRGCSWAARRSKRPSGSQSKTSPWRGPAVSPTNCKVCDEKIQLDDTGRQAASHRRNRQLEPYNAMLQGLTQATFSHAPLDVSRQERWFRSDYRSERKPSLLARTSKGA